MAAAGGTKAMDTITAALEETALGEMDVVNRHRRERKDLQAKIQGMKKNAPKSDKKKRKEAMEEVARMESEMEKRHAAELKAAQENETKNHHDDEEEKPPKEPLQTASVGEEDSSLPDDTGDTDDTAGSQQRVSKAQKRRDKKAREARQREDDIRAAAEDAEFAPKAIEAQTLQTKLRERQLALHQIASDGDCLYNAIRHQLMLSGLGAFTVEALRNETANYIRANKDSLICYMTHPRTGELLDDAEFEKYCEAVRSTPAWGGQIELKALTSVLKVPIEVLQAVGPPTVQGADEFPGPNLLITYHRHMYSLGEHYNSTMPLSELPEEDAFDGVA